MTENIRRHFTATGYVANETSILLHWHNKLRLWLPPGGHIEENEDPVQAMIREAKEETGLDVTVLPSGGPGPFHFNDPAQVQPPVTILVEDIDDPVDGFHQHIDMIYFTTLADPDQQPLPGWQWFTREQLESGDGLLSPDGDLVPPPPDVLEVGVLAIDAVSLHD
ncbi:MAG: NUDIX domain-containing protein [Chloroflexi bacterium]|nr:NUDIX domain-containing protein [Chloroflexota bacterium]